MVIRCEDEAAAKALAVVLAPDNHAIPSGQRFKMRRSASSLVFEVASVRIGSTFSTAESVLKDTGLFQEIWLLSRPRKVAARRT